MLLIDSIQHAFLHTVHDSLLNHFYNFYYGQYIGPAPFLTFSYQCYWY